MQEKVSKKFISLLKQKALEFPKSTGVNERIASNAYNLLVDAQSKGAEFLLGKPEYLDKTSIAPVLLTGVTKDMKIWDEESFGPTTTVIVVKNDQEAVQVANETSYGLDAFVHTQDLKRAMYFARHLDVGKMRVNGTTHERKSITGCLKHHSTILITGDSDFPFHCSEKQWLGNQQCWGGHRRVSNPKGCYH